MSNAWQFSLNLPMVCFHNFSVLCFCYNQKFVTLRLQIITAFMYSLLEPMVRLVWRHYIPELFKYFRMMLWEKSTLTVLILLFRMQNVFNRFTYLCLLGTKLLRLWNMIWVVPFVIASHGSNVPGYLGITVLCWNTSLFLFNNKDTIFCLTIAADVNW